MVAAMSNRELQDIAITAWEARCEANKPFGAHDTQIDGDLDWQVRYAPQRARKKLSTIRGRGQGMSLER
jgi:hypothetical protein